jgi:polyisoprenoid-binding protein YceI
MPSKEASSSASPKRSRRFFSRKHWRRWLLASVVFAAVAYVAVPWLYINVFSEPAPPPLSFEQLDKEREAASSSLVSSSEPGSGGAAVGQAVDGVWTVTAPSSAGYRVEESIAGQPKTAVGRTTTVDGSFTVANGQVTGAEVNVDLATMVSDQARRDAQFRGRIMATDEFPVATFTLTDSFALTSGTAMEAVKVQGTLSLRGTEKPATFTVNGKLEGDSIAIVASTTITFADYGIPDPSIGPVSTEDNGTIEVALTAKR